MSTVIALHNRPNRTESAPAARRPPTRRSRRHPLPQQLEAELRSLLVDGLAVGIRPDPTAVRLILRTRLRAGVDHPLRRWTCHDVLELAEAPMTAVPTSGEARSPAEVLATLDALFRILQATRGFDRGSAPAPLLLATVADELLEREI